MDRTWQIKTAIGALWMMAYALLAWNLSTTWNIQSDIAAMRATLIRLERDGQEYVVKREYDTRAAEVNRRLESLERGRP